MKKYSIFISVFLVFFSFTLTSFAQPLHYGMGSTKNDTPRVKLNLPTLDIMVSDDSVLIILNGVSDKVSDFEIYGFPEFSGPVVNSYLKKSDGEKVIWDIENIPKGNYFVYVIKKDNLNPSGTGTISTKTSIINIGGASPDLSLIYKWPLDYKIAQKNVIVSGKIDQNKYPYANESLKIRFKRSTDISKVGESEDIYIAKIADNGSYSAEISGLDPKSKYFLQQEILGGNPEVVLDTRLDRDSTFNSKDGNVLASSEEFSKSFDKRSYRLLAPWPGLSVVLDPSLCAEEKAAGRLDSNAICDINGLLNYLFKLLIGLTAVSLVLRIMFEGYQYIVTDIPFLKSSAKSHLSESFFGLVLALSAWMLLNTINPKLVSNSLNIKSVEVGIEVTAPNYSKGSTRSDTKGNKLKAILDHTSFPKDEWNKILLESVKKSQLVGSHPSDASTFLKNGDSSAENWVKLFVGISYVESSHNPGDSYKESFGEISVGLFQLSKNDGINYKYTKEVLTDAQLKDPKVNIELAVKIMEKLVLKDKVISNNTKSNCEKTGRGPCLGGARYWSTLRVGN